MALVWVRRWRMRGIRRRTLLLPPAEDVALNEAHRQMLAAGQMAGVGYWRLNVPSQALEWSAEIFRIYGLDPADGLPTLEQAIEAYHPEDREHVARTVAKAIADGSTYSSRWRLMRPDGTISHVLARGAAERDANGAVVALFGVLLDVTEDHHTDAARAELQVVTQRAREAAEESNVNLQRLARHLERALARAEQGSQAKSRFLAGISHELRTPLNGILGYAQLLQMEGKLDPLQRSRVDSMLQAGRHLLDMINRVLDLSEVEAGRLELQSSGIDLRATAALCVDFVRPGADAKALELSATVAPETPRTMLGDPTRLRQVLLNLLGNAVKFTDVGAVELHLAPAAGGSRLRVEVSDTGPGIAADRRHLLFHHFERLDAGASGAVEGAGLGLAISAQITAAMGGVIGHADNPGGGSVFWLEVPLVRPVVGPSPIIAVAHAPSAALRILVVDDVEMNRAIAAGFLDAAGHAVTCAGSGQEAIEAVRTGAFDLVFMDVRMPGMDGLEATRAIRALGAGVRVPIVALTAQAFAEQIEACRLAGMDGHLSKPFTPQSLAAAIEDGLASCRRCQPREHPAARATGNASAPDIGVFDQVALDRIATFMPQADMAQHLETLAGKAAAMRRRLSALPVLASGAMVEDAHVLAGSAGLFGFPRMAEAARQLEYAARSGAPDLQSAIGNLLTETEAAMLKMDGMSVVA